MKVRHETNSVVISGGELKERRKKNGLCQAGVATRLRAAQIDTIEFYDSGGFQHILHVDQNTISRLEHWKGDFILPLNIYEAISKALGPL